MDWPGHILDPLKFAMSFSNPYGDRILRCQSYHNSKKLLAAVCGYAVCFYLHNKTGDYSIHTSYPIFNNESVKKTVLYQRTSW